MEKSGGSGGGGHNPGGRPPVIRSDPAMYRSLLEAGGRYPLAVRLYRLLTGDSVTQQQLRSRMTYVNQRVTNTRK